ncbi:hypothetical protein HPB48_017596 [Haemaphysalis longicornis]|uniref:HSF-type DNA-binding domain-containing protein n=1 Tax=Haemaphysalis longicornis TaxID=44386 RepID=A0A9J6GKI4_HAELO|nr:hypothetical protein HPB48_017596 [Haemaphysalis longicornis]
MNPSEAPEESPLSPSSEDQPFANLSFPQKLWKIVNECESGAIAWSTDGTAVVVDYYKFLSDYLENRVDIFKTNNFTSFIRQLNLYGFRKVRSRQRATAANPGPRDFHVFQNDFFIRGRPDMLPAVTRKKGVSQDKTNQKEDGGGPGPSSGRPHQGHRTVHGGRVVNSRGNGTPSRRRQTAVRRALDRQRRAAQLVRLEKAIFASVQRADKGCRNVIGRGGPRIQTAPTGTASGARKNPPATLRPVTRRKDPAGLLPSIRLRRWPAE